MLFWCLSLPRHVLNRPPPLPAFAVIQTVFSLTSSIHSFDTNYETVDVVESFTRFD